MMHPWQKILSSNITSVEKLVSFLEIPKSLWETIDFHPPFPLSVPLRLAQKMKKGTLCDPLVLEFLPLLQERNEDGLQDPLQEMKVRKTPRLLCKYPHRALLITTSACAMHCRFCFRKHFPHEKKAPDFSSELKILEKDPSIHEVILSGGDPLSLPTQELQKLFQSLESIPHIERIRIHSRFIIGIPERIDHDLLALFKSLKKPCVLVFHINSSDEIDDDVLKACALLKETGVLLLNQAVLLKGVNDTLYAQKALSKRLIEAGVLPYYLHGLDRASGILHFEVPLPDGQKLIEEMQKELPGYMVPRYVQDIPGKPSKTSLMGFSY